jgi:hypothetical protein
MSLTKERFTGFSDLELLAIFPSAVEAPPESLLTSESEGDLMEAARAANPLKREDMLRELDKYPLMGSLFRTNTFFAEFGSQTTIIVRALFDTSAKLFSSLIRVVWALQLGLVSSREAAAGITAMCGTILDNGSGVFLGRAGKGRGVLSKRMNLFDSHSFAGLTRWSSSLSDTGEIGVKGSISDLEHLGQRPYFPLIEHRDRDALCPCGRESCIALASLYNRQGLFTLATCFCGLPLELCGPLPLLGQRCSQSVLFKEALGCSVIASQ